MIVGYNKDTLVPILKIREGSELGRYTVFDEVPVKISELNETETNFVRMFHVPSLSFRFLPARVVKGDYSGKIFTLSFEETEETISICEGQKLLVGQILSEGCLPIFDEKEISELTDKDFLFRIAGESHRIERKKETIEEYVKFYDNPSRSKFSVQKVVVKDIKESTYKGTLYNLMGSVEYMFKSEQVFKTIMH